MTLLSKHEKRDSKRLPNAANLSKSLILSLFLYFFTCFVTEDIPSPHGSRQWLECPQYTGTNHTSVYEGTYQVYASPSIRALDQATLHFMDNCRVVFTKKRDINAPRSISLSPYYKSLVKHQSDKLGVSVPYKLQSDKFIFNSHPNKNICLLCPLVSFLYIRWYSSHR